MPYSPFDAYRCGRETDIATAITAEDILPYIAKATALIRYPRQVGGNAFHHAMDVFTLALDYLFLDHQVLKLCLAHDLIEDLVTQRDEFLHMDPHEGNLIYDLTMELSRASLETKKQYLARVLNSSEPKVILVKILDRLANLKDVGCRMDVSKLKRLIRHTEEFFLPVARQDEDLYRNMIDLLKSRKKTLAHLQSFNIWKSHKKTFRPRNQIRHIHKHNSRFTKSSRLR